MVHNPYYTCGTCLKGFPAGCQARNNHCNSTGHRLPSFECDSCHLWFKTNDDCWRHMNATRHAMFFCRALDCSFVSPSVEGRLHHEHDFHHFCADCKRFFDNRNNLNMHLNSRTHRGDNMSCPFCKRTFATAAGMTHHLENNACPNVNLDRDTMYRAVRAKDPGGLISKNLIGYTGQTSYSATDMAWNGDAWECYFCHRGFRQRSSLDQHLKSPAHQQALYHCPNARCRAQFKSLAAAINHLESESCAFMRFEAVQTTMANLISSDRRLTF